MTMLRAVAQYNRISLIGYYGYHNFGDEWLLRSIIHQLNQYQATHTRDSHHISIIYTNQSLPVRSTAYTRITAVPRWSISQLYQTVRDSDAVVFGGGSVFQDITSRRSVLYYSFILALANYHKKPVYFWASGFGPLRPTARCMMRGCMPPQLHIACRDSLAQSVATTIWPQAVYSPIIPDITDSDSPDTSASPSRVIGSPVLSPVSSQHGIGLAIYNRGLPDAIMQWLKTQDRLIGLQSHTESGYTHCDRVYQLMQLLNPAGLDWSAAQGILGPLRCVISMRYHALKLAHRLGCACIGISDDPKIRALCDEIRAPYIRYSQLNLQALQQALQPVL